MSSDPDPEGVAAPIPGNAAKADDIWDVEAVVRELADARRNRRTVNAQRPEYGSESFPSRTRINKVVDELAGALFPLRLGPDFVRLHNEDLDRKSVV